ncbi:19786_t:CDS:2 [Rhizophagus irregularis]|nr:19786_t:CDS:2 [Rhizophagus irregularis]
MKWSCLLRREKDNSQLETDEQCEASTKDSKNMNPNDVEGIQYRYRELVLK